MVFLLLLLHLLLLSLLLLLPLPLPLPLVLLWSGSCLWLLLLSLLVLFLLAGEVCRREGCTDFDAAMCQNSSFGTLRSRQTIFDLLLSFLL